MIRLFRIVMVFTLANVFGSDAKADLTVFGSQVDFDESVELDSGRGLGLRWGKSSRIFGGESSLMIARPQRMLSDGTKKPMTAVFYEGRLLLNIPTSTSVRPFFGVGLGMILLTSIDVTNPELPSSPSANDYLSRVEGNSGASDLQNNRALSYGGGVRYALGEKLAARLDLRRYTVFSVMDYAQDRANELIDQEIEKFGTVGDAALERISAESTKKKNVQHNEVSLGLMFSF
ncbi:MAG: outer membrane beta-barrel protein [Candidatus Latescibacterota bacterium]|nr:outer membrane beta-barrel protein [Candidatus Latescibacterota bacterium]